MKQLKSTDSKILIYIAIVLLIIVYAVNKLNQPQLENPTSQITPSQNPVNRNNCLSDDCLLVEDLQYPVGQLPPSVQQALEEAITDEYKALSTYEAVIAKFGPVRPFSMIKGAEEQHIASLKAIYDKYGLEIPQNTWSDKVTAPDTLQQACQIGVDAEIANAALYRDKLLPAVQDYQDIVAVFTNISNASDQKHLPSFQRCN